MAMMISEHKNCPTLSGVKDAIAAMSWHDLEELARLIEVFRRKDASGRSSKKLTAEMIYEAVTLL